MPIRHRRPIWGKRQVNEKTNHGFVQLQPPPLLLLRRTELWWRHPCLDQRRTPWSVQSERKLTEVAALEVVCWRGRLPWTDRCADAAATRCCRGTACWRTAALDLRRYHLCTASTKSWINPLGPGGRYKMPEEGPPSKKIRTFLPGCFLLGHSPWLLLLKQLNVKQLAVISI